VRTLIHSAAVRHGLDPDRFSYTVALRIVRRHVANPVDAGLWASGRMSDSAEAELLRRLLRPRRARENPRVVKRKMSKFPAKRAHHRGVLLDGPLADTIEVTHRSRRCGSDREGAAGAA
jgi:hypothetical protein